MTRGKIFFVSDELVYCSVEFNGDMHPECNGESAMALLEKSNDWHEFTKNLEKFDKRFYHYEEITGRSVYVSRIFSENFFDFSQNYYEKFGSDYLYIKNNANHSIDVLDKNKNKVVVAPKSIICFYFGEQYSS